MVGVAGVRAADGQMRARHQWGEAVREGTIDHLGGYGDLTTISPTIISEKNNNLNLLNSMM